MRDWLLAEGRLGLLMLSLPFVFLGMAMWINSIREGSRAQAIVAMLAIGVGVAGAMTAIEPRDRPEPWSLNEIYGLHDAGSGDGN